MKCNPSSYPGSAGNQCGEDVMKFARASSTGCRVKSRAAFVANVLLARHDIPFFFACAAAIGNS